MKLKIEKICFVVAIAWAASLCLSGGVLAGGPALKQGERKVALVNLEKVKEPLVSAGVPFALGQLGSDKNIAFFDEKGSEIPIATKVLAYWPQDRSVRSVLVQFRYPLSNELKYVTMRWGSPRTTKDQKIIEPDGGLPEGFILLPADWLCASGVIGEQVPMGQKINPQYDENIVKYFPRVSQQKKTGELGRDGYYSTPHVFYQLYVRTGDLQYFLAAREELLYYRDEEIVQSGSKKGRAKSGDKTRYVYVEAMADDYLLTGDPKTLEVAGYMADYLRNATPPSKAFIGKNNDHFWTERDIAFPFLGIVTYYELTLDAEYLKAADGYMFNLHKTQMEWPQRGGFIHNLYAHDPQEGARPDEWGGSPFMTGLLLEAIIKYHKITGSEIAKDSMLMALDWLVKEGLTYTGDSFKYVTADKYRGSDGDPDINLLLAHAFGYGYRLSGYSRVDYLNLGQKVFGRGVRQSFLKDQKHFNQNYRSSGHYLAYILDGLSQGFEQKVPSTEKKREDLENSLIYEDFENSSGGFQSLGDSTLSIEEGKLKIRSKTLPSSLSARVLVSSWATDKFPLVTFLYKIPRGTPVGMRVLTPLGDWVCLGGTAQHKCSGGKPKAMYTLNDDGAWHEIRVNVALAVQNVLAGIRELTEFQFITEQNADVAEYFWIDDFKVMKKK